MTFKTYTRARSATAALAKIIAGYELPAESFTITGVETADGRFYAHVVFAGDMIDARILHLLIEDMNGRFNFKIDRQEEKAEAAKAETAARASRYINEVSTIERPTKRVWAIADMMPEASRKEVIAACREAGIAYGTARTQYQAWFAAQPKS